MVEPSNPSSRFVGKKYCFVSRDHSIAPDRPPAWTRTMKRSMEYIEMKNVVTNIAISTKENTVQIAIKT